MILAGDKLKIFPLCVLLFLCVPKLSCFGQISWYVNEVGKALAAQPLTGVVFCKYYECCTSDWIINNTAGLQAELNRRLYGQDLVKKVVLNHIQGHVRTVGVPPSKPLVLSFHGPTGTGKNHVSRIIAESMYKEGLKSENVRLISVPASFPHHGRINAYKDSLQKLIENQVKKCERSLFIFDEIDKMPRGLIDTIKPYLDYHHALGGVDYRHAMFLFLSNSGDRAITEYMLQQLRDGRRREEIKLKEVETILAKAAITSEGLWHSELIGSHLVTAFIPFLPLERRQIRHCIKDSLVTKKYYPFTYKIPDKVVEEVMSEMHFYPREEQLFSVTGCKRVAEKVDYVMQS